MTMSRRDFLRLGSGAVALGVIPRGRSSGPVRIGVIGAGAQGLALINALMTSPMQARVTALCDVSQIALESASTLFHDSGLPLPRLTQDARELLSWSEVQAVIIATADFSHTPLTLAALDAGKDVYLETPLTRTLEEFNSLQQAAQRAGRIIFPGDTSLSQPVYTLAAQYLRAGLIGAVSRVHITSHLSTAPMQTMDESSIDWTQFLLYLAPRRFDAHLWAQWQDMSEASDGLAMAQLARSAGIVQRVLDLSQPTRIAAHGGVYISGQRRDTPDTLYALLEYAEGCVVNFSAYPGDPTHDVLSLYGTRGTLDLHHMRVTTDSAIETPISDAMAQQATQQLTQAARSVDPLRHHLACWLEALQSRRLPAGILSQAADQIHVGQRAMQAYRG